MKIKLCVLLTLLLLLLACVRIEKSERSKTEKTEETGLDEEIKVYTFNRAFQNLGGKTILYGFDENDNIILINNSEETTYFFYEKDKLARTNNNDKEINFNYNKGVLDSITSKYETNEFLRDSWNRLVEIKNNEKLFFVYDPSDRLSSFKRDLGPLTTFEYDELGRIKNFTKGKSTTKAYYDDEERLKLLDTDNNFLVIAYWREDLLSSLSGDVYGLKETISYSPNEIRIISATDESSFTSEIEELRIKALNLYLFCKKFKKIPVVFDGLSYILAYSYLKMSPEDYIVMDYYCDALG